ncbi:zinc finger BED domain-containing protein RICESLEEPER 2-like [Rhizophagus irregularis DAOM 181602=DAOM 197198]|nr:zinc finger BED domain-containing protein RICESLEEPER 2-like [Rhizophagus irregularis DAOM 181602=DAOM 197198]
MDAEDNNEGSCHNSEDEIDASLPATPARRLSNLESLENAQNNQGSFQETQSTGVNVLEMLKAPKWSYDHNEMINNLVKWIVIKQHAFTIAEEPEFINFIHSLHPTAKIPSADTIKSHISNFYRTDREKVQNILLNIPGKISFTIDCWTSSSVKSFLSITAHFINKDWKLQHILLDITLDNASNNAVFIRLLTNWAIEKRIFFDKNDNHFRCFAHVINLSVQVALTQLESEISKLRDLVNRICASSLRREKLKMACKNNQLKDLTLIPDVPTRWNSTYEMISRSLQLKINQWAELEKIKDFLFLFKEVTTIMFGFTYPTLSTTIPLYNILIDHVENVIGDVNVIGDENEEVIEDVDDESEANSGNNNENEWSQIIKNAAKICRLKLLEYYNKTNYSYLISTILDPRLKLQYYKDNEWGDELINDIQQKFLSMYNKSYAVSIQSDQTETPNKKKSVMSRVFKRHRVESSADEYQIYLSLPQLDGNEDPLEWWKNNEQQFPSLAKMARDFLLIPATSVPSEQVFSSGKNLITDKRNRLVGKTIRMCLCLRSWWSLSLFNSS